MKTVHFARLFRPPALALLIGAAGLAQAGNGLAAAPTITKETITMQAKGTFDVQLTPQDAATDIGATKIGRMKLDKQFHGDLAAASVGEMLAMRTDVQGSAGYVAMEHVNGTLQGRKGTFVLQHSGTMNRGAAALDLNVVPDSGTGELKGLSGSMKIEIVEGKHRYIMDYVLPTENAGTP
jgi:hypothetical protein